MCARPRFGRRVSRARVSSWAAPTPAIGGITTRSRINIAVGTARPRATITIGTTAFIPAAEVAAQIRSCPATITAMARIRWAPIAGDDGAGNQVGVAPGAKWIGCRNMNQGVGTPATYIECFEFFLAPYPVGGTPAQGDPDPRARCDEQFMGLPGERRLFRGNAAGGSGSTTGRGNHDRCLGRQCGLGLFNRQ